VYELSLSRKCYSVFHEGGTSLHSHQQCVPDVSYLRRHLLMDLCHSTHHSLSFKYCFMASHKF
jgi:hypothetical protein